MQRFIQRTAVNGLKTSSSSLWPSRSLSGFSFAGPKGIDQILDKDAVGKLNGDELATVWKDFHAQKKGTIGWVVEGSVGKLVLHRANSKNGKFFISPVFRDVEEAEGEGESDAQYYNLIVQFFDPSHFVLANLQDYQSDPANAKPVISFSVFDDYIESKNMTLVRADIIVDTFKEGEPEKILGGILKRFDGRTCETDWVDKFNNSPAEFDFEGFIEDSRKLWFEKDKVVTDEEGGEGDEK
mmetsp:Transcript_17351/g.35764  ORF Transcript_17351/g.35764 Transcript_17351/m.35764 type:complete len:240 (-) Transcript_17351:12-731(-)